MKVHGFYVLVLAVVFGGCGASESGPRFHRMSHNDIDTLLFEVGSKSMTVTEKMNFFSEYFLDTPYDFESVGDGRDAVLEPWPLVNFEKTNCMAFCEHVLALSISDSWDHFFNNLQQIRYRDGIIGMRTRNHYVMADWLPENGWILEDVTTTVGPGITDTVSRTVSHESFFARKGIRDLRHVRPERTVCVDYVPRASFPDIEPNLEVGDILVLILAGEDSIFAAHMLMIAADGGKKIAREASTSIMNTFDTPYDEWAGAKLDNERYLGMSVLRVREEINRPGRIVFPWEISSLKPGN